MLEHDDRSILPSQAEDGKTVAILCHNLLLLDWNVILGLSVGIPLAIYMGSRRPLSGTLRKKSKSLKRG